MADVRTVALSLVSIVVAIIVIATVAVPVIDQMSGNVDYSGGSNGTPTARYTDYSGQKLTYQWSAGTTTINGVDVGQAGQRPALITNKVMIRAGAQNYYIYDMQDEKMVYSNQITDVTITCDIGAGGVYSVLITKGGTVTRYTSGIGLDKCIALDPNGKIGVFSGSTPIKANVGDRVFWGNWTSSSWIRFADVSQGTPTNWFEPFSFTGSGDNLTLTQISGTTTTVNYNVQNVDGVATSIAEYSSVRTTGGESTQTTGEWFAPISYSGGTIAADGGINSTLLALVPLLLFIVAIMMAVRTMKGV